MKPTVTYDSSTDILYIANHDTKIEIKGEAIKATRAIHDIDLVYELAAIFRYEANGLAVEDYKELCRQLEQHIDENYSN